jgi:phosphatidyl-myo-inositol dimannoside synthase
MPSRGEGFGLVYADAMRHGLPVIASSHDAGAEIVADGVTGFCVSLDVPAELSRRLCELLDAPRHAEAMGQAGQRRWQEHFRFSAFRDRFGRILDEACRMSDSPAQVRPRRARGGGRKAGS